MDDPTLNVDTLLDEYFTRLYGPAAGPMRKFYDAVEQAYGNPANYPEAIAAGKIEGHHHQTEEVAWGYLGNAKRMETLGRLMDEAKAAAQTAEQKQRVALFEMGTWDYMTAGRKQYVEHVKARYGEGASMLRVPFSSRGLLQRDLTKIDAAEALALTGWRSRIAEPTRRKPAAWLVHDGEYLYVVLRELRDPMQLGDPKQLTLTADWQVLFASQRDGPVHNLLVNAVGRPLLDGKPTNVAMSAGRDGATVALPLEQMGVKPGERFYLNLVRRSGSSDDQPMWSPSFGEFESPAALRELTLDAADTIPANLPTREEFQRLDAQGLVARWKLDERQGVAVYSTDVDLTGKLVNGVSSGEDGNAVRGATARQPATICGLRQRESLRSDRPVDAVGLGQIRADRNLVPGAAGQGLRSHRRLRAAHPPRRHRVVRTGRPRRHTAHP